MRSRGRIRHKKTGLTERRLPLLYLPSQGDLVRGPFSRNRMYKCYTLLVNGDDLFDWDESNEEHVLDPAEVEEAVLDPDGIGADARNVAGEERAALIGATESGRVLHVVYTIRGERVRPITARDADGTEKRRYRRGRE